MITGRGDRNVRAALNRLLLILLSVVPLLMILSLVTGDHRVIHSRFDIDGEATVPAWYSTLLLFCVAQCAIGIHCFRRRTEANARMAFFWLIFAIVFCFLSLDEAARIHEVFGERLNIKWIFVYAPFAAVFFAVCVYFFVAVEPQKTLGRWILGGLIIFASGGLGGESYSYFFGSSMTEKVFEESFEMFGAIVILTGCLRELIRRIGQVWPGTTPASSRAFTDESV